MLPLRIELRTSPLPRECSTTELRQHRRGFPAASKSRWNAAILAIRASVAQPFTMTDRPRDQQKENRARRLSAALRDNLKRRKAQAKERNKGRNLGRSAERRAKSSPAGSSTETHDSAGFGNEKPNN